MQKFNFGEVNRERKITSVTLWGAGANLALSVMKMLAGVLGHSSAMVADAVHSVSDLVSDAVVLIMVKLSSRKTDKGHDYGHGKFETLATVCISVILLVVGARLLGNSVAKIKFVAEGGTLDSPGKIALAAALVSIAVKEFMYQWTARVGRKYDSTMVSANAWHHRSDALSSVGSALGIGGAILLGGKWTVLDPIVGCIISIVILVVAVKMALPAFGELTEASLPDRVEAEIVGIIESVPGVVNAHALKTRKVGPDIVIDSHIVVNPRMSVVEAHDISTKVEEELRKEYGPGTQISIHIEPDEGAD